MYIDYKSIFEYPLCVTWELINVCNYQCIHCRMEEDNFIKESIPLEKIKDIINQLSEIGVRSIIYTGGELFLRQDIFDILEYTDEKGIEYSLNTNGSLLEESMIERLSKLKMLRLVQVSLDGKDANTHDYVRNKDGAFDKVIDTLKLLKKYQIRTGVDTTLMKINYFQIDEIVKLLVSIGVDSFGARRFMPIGHGNHSSKELMVSSTIYKKHCELWCQLVEKYRNKIQLYIEEPLMGILSEQLPDEWILGGCVAGSINASIMADGTVQPCVITPISLGSLHEKSFAEIWESSKETRRVFFDRELLEGKCGICEKKDLCGGCRGVAYAMKGSYTEADPFCFY